MKAFAAVVAAASLFCASVLADVDPIVIKGSKFFYQTNGTQFFIKGIAYQQDYAGNGTVSSNVTYVDPLANADDCHRDIPYLVQLGTNVVRVYAIDPTQNHDECMNALADAGIYVIADLAAPVEGQSINQDSPSWNDELYARYTAVIDDMQKYTNTMGFFAGNEVANNVSNTNSAPFVKAAIRDMKKYISNQKYRSIGVGYATNDNQYIRVDLADYFDCGDSSSAADFWGYNIYSWCGNSTYEESGYNERTAEFANYNIPVFFAEYGCNQPSPRHFTEVQALYGPQMSPVWSGGIVYMYFQEANDFGLVSVDGNSVSTLDDFNYLSMQIASISPSGVNAGSYNPTNTAAQNCPTTNSDWAAATALPPTPNRELCQCMYQALTCVPNNVDETKIGKLFGVVCGLADGVCDGITANGTSPGTYGAYGMCNATEQLGWALNDYYLKQDSQNRASACDFSGSATTQSPVTPTGQCASLVSQAGADGTGTVTAQPSGSGGSSGSKNAGTPGFSSPPVFSSTLAISLYMAFAFVSGAGMILL